MFKPQFTYTNSLINHLTLIERLYGQLISEKLIPSLSLKLSEENQILATHYSTSIEGNPLSQREVTNILLGDAIPTNKSELEVKNYFQALNHISVEVKKHKSLSIKLALDLHRLVMHRIDAKQPGLFRNQKVIVGHRGAIGLVVKQAPPFHKAPLIRASLEELFNYINQPSDLNPFIQAGILHHQVAYIHPFTDGNGRVTRLLTAYYLLLHGYEVTKYFILDDYYDIDRQLYSDTLHTADSGDETNWMEYFLEGIAYSLQAALARINELKHKDLEEVTGEKRVLVTSREEEVLQLVIDKKAVKTSDVGDLLGVTRQQAHALLASLVKKGLLSKFGKTKTSYYKLVANTKSLA